MSSERWDAYFLRLAREAASMSKDPSSQIGAVVVHRRNVIATGFNGFPPGIADDARLLDRERKYLLVVHAEMNALLKAGPQAVGSTLYLWGFKGAPCANCAKHLLAAGVVRYVAAGKPVPDRWADSLRESESMFREARIRFEYVDLP